jgi:alpha-tubulin suppressor-like RCC1 family protein
MSSDIIYQLEPKVVRELKKFCIVKINSGATHTAAIDQFGRLFTFGSNKFGQLGVGDFKAHSGLNIISGSLISHHVSHVSCGVSINSECVLRLRLIVNLVL